MTLVDAIVPVLFVVALIATLTLTIGYNLHTATGRAKWTQARVLDRRTAELILRGYDEYDAKRIAENEHATEARAITTQLRKEGIES